MQEDNKKWFYGAGGLAAGYVAGALIHGRSKEQKTKLFSMIFGAFLISIIARITFVDTFTIAFTPFFSIIFFFLMDKYFSHNKLSLLVYAWFGIIMFFVLWLPFANQGLNEYMPTVAKSIYKRIKYTEEWLAYKLWPDKTSSELKQEGLLTEKRRIQEEIEIKKIKKSNGTFTAQDKIEEESLYRKYEEIEQEETLLTSRNQEIIMDYSDSNQDKNSSLENKKQKNANDTGTDQGYKSEEKPATTALPPPPVQVENLETKSLESNPDSGKKILYILQPMTESQFKEFTLQFNPGDRASPLKIKRTLSIPEQMKDGIISELSTKINQTKNYTITVERSGNNYPNLNEARINTDYVVAIATSIRQYSKETSVDSNRIIDAIGKAKNKNGHQQGSQNSVPETGYAKQEIIVDLSITLCVIDIKNQKIVAIGSANTKTTIDQRKVLVVGGYNRSSSETSASEESLQVALQETITKAYRKLSFFN